MTDQERSRSAEMAALTDFEIVRRAAFADEAELRGLADEMRRRILGCTGITAAWCPVHGDCRCPDRESGGDLDDPSCPLHGADGHHGEAPQYDGQEAGQ